MNRMLLPDLPAEIVYLDHAATSLKPQVVVARVATYLSSENGSPNRGAHRLSVASTALYHRSKEKVRTFLNAPSDWEVVYTKNATEALNLLATGLPEDLVGPGDEVVLAINCHHSNLLPWQRLTRRRGALLTYLYVDDQGHIPEAELQKITERTKVVAWPYISNALGNITSVNRLTQKAQQVGALSVVDGAQAVGHIPVDLLALGADCFVFSAHKVYAPTGIGVLMASRSLLDRLEPMLVGGDMIEFVTETDASYAPVPQRLEAGTQNVVGAVGLLSALEWLESIGMTAIERYERQLTKALYQALSERPDIELYGPKSTAERGAIVSFNVKGVHPHDVASILDSKGVAIRAGHHCCQPLMHQMGVGATCRASLGYYNDQKDIEALLGALDLVQEVFGGHVEPTIY